MNETFPTGAPETPEEELNNQGEQQETQQAEVSSEQQEEGIEKPEIEMSGGLLTMTEVEIGNVLDEAEHLLNLLDAEQEIVTHLKGGPFTRGKKALVAALVIVSNMGAPEVKASGFSDLFKEVLGGVAQEAAREAERELPREQRGIYRGAKRGVDKWKRDQERARREAENARKKEEAMEERARAKAESDAYREQVSAERDAARARAEEARNKQRAEQERVVQEQKRQKIGENIRVAEDRIKELSVEIGQLEREIAQNRTEEEVRLEGEIKQLLGDLALYSPEIAVEVQLDDMDDLDYAYRHKRNLDGSLSASDQAEYDEKLKAIEGAAELRADFYERRLQMVSGRMSEVQAKRMLSGKAREIERDLKKARDLLNDLQNEGEDRKIKDLKREKEGLQDDISDWNEDLRDLSY